MSDDELFDLYMTENETIITSLRAIYNNGKADGKTEAIEEHFTKIMSFINTSNRGNCDYFIVDQIENYIAEQLKEQK